MQNVTIPDYTKGEERFNWITHGAGAVLSVIGLVLALIIAWGSTPLAIVSVAVYGVTMILLYTMSAVYHAVPKDAPAKKVMRVFDHCTIFLLIAGTYTPFSLITLKNAVPWLGWTVFAAEWTFAVAGIILNIIDLKKFGKISMACYLAMGWCAVLSITVLVKNMLLGGLILLFAGGVAYTVGAAFYGFGKRKKYIHSVWHLFVLLGSVLMFLSVVLYVL